MPKFVNVFLILLTLTRPILSNAESVPQCPELEDACNKAIEIADFIINEQGQIITKKQEVIDTLQERVGNLAQERDELEASQSAWYKNPLVLFGFGFIAGVLVENK